MRKISNLCNRVRQSFLSRVGGQGDPCGRVPWGRRTLNTQSCWGWVDCQRRASRSKNSLSDSLCVSKAHPIKTSEIIKSKDNEPYPCAMSPEWAATVVITGDWGLVADTGATTVGSTAVEVVTMGRDCNTQVKVNKWWQLSFWVIFPFIIYNWKH